MTTSRRAFLAGASGACALGLAARSPSALASGGLLDRTVPGTTRRFGILEIFFSGALSHRETLWVEQPNEDPVVRRIGALDPRTHPLLAPAGAPASWTSWLPAAGAHLGASYAQGSGSGGTIHLGPCAEPLVRATGTGTRPADRLRVVATGHDLDVHEPAQTYMLQGAPARRSDPRAAGVAAAISRHTGLRSYVFYDARLNDPRHTAIAASAVGNHGLGFAPLQIPYDDPSLVDVLVRPRSARRDALSAHYASRYESRLTFAHPAAAGQRARSVALDAFLTAQHAAISGPLLASSLAELSVSRGETLWDNPVRRAIKASVGILGAGLSGYCCVVDGGVVGSDNGGFSHYDSHYETSFDTHAAVTTGNVLNVLRTLREEIDAGRLDLDRTLVVLSTEFGRSFSVESGTDHCAPGFAVALLGGPIPTGARGVVGDLPFVGGDDGDARERSAPAYATGGLEPGQPVSATDLRAVVLQAAGIHPFQFDLFRQEDSTAPDTVSADDAADQLARHLFGL